MIKIKNERQYETTKYQLAKFESALTKCRESAKNLDPRLQEAIVAGIQSQIEDLKQELTEYDEKMSMIPKIFRLSNAKLTKKFREIFPQFFQN